MNHAVPCLITSYAIPENVTSYNPRFELPLLLPAHIQKIATIFKDDIYSADRRVKLVHMHYPAVGGQVHL
jgi:hypothetical protein